MKTHEIKQMRLADLKAAAYNPRRITGMAMKGLQASLGKFGLVQPIVFNKRFGTIVGGHQRVQALKAMGQKTADVVVVDLSLADEKALNISLNNPEIAGEFTDDLQELLLEIQKEIPQGFVDLRMDELLSLSLDGAGIVEDAPPALPKKAVTQPGDIWQMGQHRLLCGDSTKTEDVAGLLGPKDADMIFTDPPWNVSIGLDSNPKHLQREGLKNDSLGATHFRPFLKSWADACLPRNKGDLYCVMGCGEWPTIDAVLRDAGMHWSATIVWVKDVFVLGRSQYHRRFEPIWYGWNQKGKSSFTGQRDQDDVWEIPRPKVSEDHPTMKPVELCARAINNSSKGGGLVFDPFAGAGSTLIACQQINRRFVGIEIDPKFCDVIVKRWEAFTDGKAKRV